MGYAVLLDKYYQPIDSVVWAGKAPFFIYETVGQDPYEGVFNNDKIAICSLPSVFTKRDVKEAIKAIILAVNVSADEQSAEERAGFEAEVAWREYWEMRGAYKR